MMSKNKQYENAVDMVRDLLGEDDKTFADELEKQIDSRQLVRFLATMRNKMKVTQSDVAREMECKQSKISKIENGYDDDVKMGEMTAYAKAFDCDIVVQFVKQNETTFERIKRHVQWIHRDLCHLANLAQNDEEIARGVARTFGEVLFNHLRLLDIAAQKLPNDPKTDEPYFNLSVGMAVSDDNDTMENDMSGAATAEQLPKGSTPPVILA